MLSKHATRFGNNVLLNNDKESSPIYDVLEDMMTLIKCNNQPILKVLVIYL